MLRNFKTFSRFTETKGPFLFIWNPQLLAQCLAYSWVSTAVCRIWFSSSRSFVIFIYIFVCVLYVYNYVLSFTCIYIYFSSSDPIHLMLWDFRWQKCIGENYRVRRSGPFTPRIKKDLYWKWCRQLWWVSGIHSAGCAEKGMCWASNRASSTTGASCWIQVNSRALQPWNIWVHKVHGW